MSIDDLMDALQKMIDLLRFIGEDVSQECDDWEKRLYQAYDDILEVTAEVQQTIAEADKGKPVTLTGQQGKGIIAMYELRDEIKAFGDELMGLNDE